MHRQIILDTETTGLNAKLGNRIIEIGCVELVQRKLTGNNFHRYINPERDSEEGALAVHGLTRSFLDGHPKFVDIVDDFIAYVKGAEIVIHNAPFDVGFFDEEFARLKLEKFETHVGLITDTLVQAKQMFPGKKNNLNALCSRFDISTQHRKFHGALLDAELLAEVFLALSRGQHSFAIESEETIIDKQVNGVETILSLSDAHVFAADSFELDAHEKTIKEIGTEIKGVAIWDGYKNI
ncbi:MAG: DNA polymerase III subunit epsilon [Burkholderiaceae bacterium]|nr:DNA polymerase III subunit epsilon [Burkholderiaceae bacterium]